MKKVNVFYKLAFDLFWLLVMTNTVLADTPVSGIISSNTTWTLSASPYIVTGNVLVNSGVTLTIEPGVVVKFDTDKAIQINGELIAVGTDGNLITFTSNQPTPTAGDWAYVFFSDTSIDATFDVNGIYTSGSILEYCVVEYAGGVTASYNGAVRMDDAHPFINHCTIQNNSASGINAYNLSDLLKIASNTIAYNEDTGIYFVGGTVTVFGNFVHNNTESGGNAGGIYAYTSTCLISNNIVSDNHSGGGVFINNGTATISGNIINGNHGGSGGGVRDYSSDTTISNNIIFDNMGTIGGGIYGGDAISNNIISNNLASYESGGIYGGDAISNNSIIRNSAPNAAALSQGADLNYNLIADNNSSGTEPTYTLNISTHLGAFNYNNFFNISTD